MQIIMNRLEKLGRWGQKLGPYLLLEMLLPGGTLIALVLFLCRDGRLDTTGFAVRAALTAARALKQGIRMARPFLQWPAHAYHPAGRPVYDGSACRG